MIKSLVSLGVSTWFSMLSWYLFDGYSTTGFSRPVNEDGEADLVVNDWWPITGCIALVTLIAGLAWLFEWMNDE